MKTYDKDELMLNEKYARTIFYSPTSEYEAYYNADLSMANKYGKDESELAFNQCTGYSTFIITHKKEYYLSGTVKVRTGVECVNIEFHNKSNNGAVNIMRSILDEEDSIHKEETLKLLLEDIKSILLGGNKFDIGLDASLISIIRIASTFATNSNSTCEIMLPEAKYGTPIVCRIRFIDKDTKEPNGICIDIDKAKMQISHEYLEDNKEYRMFGYSEVFYKSGMLSRLYSCLADAYLRCRERKEYKNGVYEGNDGN